jgi:hypothetical protein
MKIRGLAIARARYTANITWASAKHAKADASAAVRVDCVRPALALPLLPSPDVADAHMPDGLLHLGPSSSGA